MSRSNRRAQRSITESIPEPIPTLSTLIAQRRNQLRLSYKVMADRANEAGFQITEAAFNALVKDVPRRFPQPETLQALAVVLDLPIHDVAMAACRSVGLFDDDTDTGRRAAVVVAELTKDLNAAQVDQVLDLVRSAVRLIKPDAAGPAEAT